MKKTLIALAALAATGAFAQSSVTIYGRLDAGYSNNVTTVDVTNVGSYEKKDHGVSNDTLNSSYWGLKGSEDLGGGLKANFNLEQSVAIDSGVSTTSTGFQRISTLGLEGGFGRVDIGRYYTPLFQTAAMSDVFGQARTTTVNLANADGARSSNGVFYASPSFSGFSAKAMLSMDDNSDKTGATVAGGTSRNVGLSGTYANGPLLVSLAAGQNETTVALTGVNGRNEASAFSATYDFGPAKLFAGYIRAKATTTAVVGAAEATETNLGVSVPFGKTTVMAAWGRNTANSDLAGATIDGSGNDWLLGVTYDLSKRTALYAKTGTFNKFDGRITVGTSTINGSLKTNDTSIGVRHLF